MKRLFVWVGEVSPALVFFCLLVWVCAHAMPSPDLWWQLCGGREVVVLGRWPPSVDLYSFTAEGRPWLNHEWLAEVIMFLVHGAWGVGGLHVAKVVMVACTYVLLAHVATRWVRREWVVWVACGVALCNAEWRSFLDVRPYLVTYLGLALAWRVGEGFLQGGRRLGLWTLPFVFMLWGNMHSGVIAGLGLLGVMALSAGDRGRGLALAGCAALCAAATCVNPFGVEVLTYPFEFVGREDDWTRFLNEWARPDWLGAQKSFTVFAVATGVAWMAARRRLPARSGFVLLAFFVLATRAWRNLPLFALVSVPTWAVCLEVCADRVASVWGSRPGVLALGRYVLMGTGWLAMVGGASLLVRTEWAGLSLEREMFPQACVRFLATTPLPDRLLNAYGWGGYVAWTLWPRYRVFMDGRASTVYPERVYHDFLVATQGVSKRGVGDWQEVLARYGVHVVLVNRWETRHRAESIGRALGRSRQWRCVYSDGVAKVYVDGSVRGVALSRGAASTGQGGLAAWPVQALVEDAEECLACGGVEEARALLDEACRREPAVAQAWFLAGVVAVRRGEVGLGEELTVKALEIDPSLPEAHYNLAVLRRLRGDVEGARREVELELKVNPESSSAQGLARQLRGGD